ncbi:hypothetical protein MHB43_30540 [Paenibacillus sp. FSL H8-0317]|uniref:hypothetical protein n=1 Tax=Paenibacillus sp. FSL H8-0317 TaxID=2921385 RepID=UPI00324D5F6E
METPYSILSTFVFGEKAVYTRSGGFNFNGSSIVGTQILCITNKGRIIVYDSGGIFGSETILEQYAMPGKIKVTSLSHHLIKVTSTSAYPFSFEFSFTVDEFETCLNQIPFDCFQLPEGASSELPAYVSYENKGKSYINLGIKANQIDLKENLGYGGTIITIPFHRISNIEKAGEYSVELKGIFDINHKKVSLIRLFLPTKDKIHALLGLYSIAPKITDLVGYYKGLYPVTLKKKINTDEQSAKLIATLVQRLDGIISIIDEKNWLVLGEFHPKVDECYYQSDSKRVIILKKNTLYVIEAIQADTILLLKQYRGSNYNTLHDDKGFLYGTYASEKYQGEKVCMLLGNDTSLQFLLWNAMSLISASEEESQTEIIKCDNMMFLLQGSDIAMVDWKNEHWLSTYGEKRVGQLNGHKIGYDMKNQPFYFEQNEMELIFRQSNNEIMFTYINTEIKEISVAEAITDHSQMTLVDIHTLTNSEKGTFSLPVQEIPSLIYLTYHHTKIPLVMNTPPSQLYLSWTRQVNDFALYHLFGQLYALQAGIQQIKEDSVKDPDESNLKLLNFLYYAIQNQKRRLDQVSIYLPAMLEHKSSMILGQAQQQQNQDHFRQIQYGFMGISAKVKQSLSEIESALSPVYSLLVPKQSIEAVFSNRTKRGYGQSIVTLGASIATIAISGGIGIPFLLGGAFTGINTYFSEKENRMKTEMDSNHDQNRIEFHMTKALDIFEHLMQTLIPFYVSETNRYMISGFEGLARTYNIVKIQKWPKVCLMKLINTIRTNICLLTNLSLLNGT